MTFAQAQGLTRHLARKFPCIERGDTTVLHTSSNRCTICGQAYSTAGNLERHKKKVCLRKLAVEPTVAQMTRADPLVEMQSRIASLERIIEEQKQQPVVNYAASSTGIPSNATNNMIVNNIGGTVSNIVNVNNVTIAPWGSPLQLTDADVEAALATVPGIAGTPAIPEVVAALMELVKRAHVAPAARNIHLNPKRTDQALALMPGGWAAMPLEEATAALFDGASASMAAARAPSVRQTVRMSIPVQYRTERAASVALGLRPMGAHLLNVAPGGPGPLLIEAIAAAAGIVPAANMPPTAVTQPLDPARAVARLKEVPVRYSTPGVIDPTWLTDITAAAGVSTGELVLALRRASAVGACGMAEWQEMMRFRK